jgi:hypothetical protein
VGLPTIQPRRATRSNAETPVIGVGDRVRVLYEHEAHDGVVGSVNSLAYGTTNYRIDFADATSAAYDADQLRGALIKHNSLPVSESVLSNLRQTPCIRQGGNHDMSTITTASHDGASSKITNDDDDDNGDDTSAESNKQCPSVLPP